MHARASNRLFLFIFVSMIAQLSFVFLFAYNYFDAFIGVLQITFPSNAHVASLYDMTSRTVSPLILKFDATMGIWTTINAAFCGAALVIRYVD